LSSYANYFKEIMSVRTQNAKVIKEAKKGGSLRVELNFEESQGFNANC
jgi:hypothetical protein